MNLFGNLAGLEWNYTSTLPIRLHGVVLSYSTGTTLPLPWTGIS